MLDTNFNSVTGKLYKYSSVGCYPLFYLDSKNKVLCADCADDFHKDEELEESYKPKSVHVNWENTSLHCGVCCERIESAYAEEGE